MTHADVMANHVRHRTRQQMRLVDINIDADANRTRRAHGLRHRHARLAASERLAAIKVIKENP